MRAQEPRRKAAAAALCALGVGSACKQAAACVRLGVVCGKVRGQTAQGGTEKKWMGGLRSMRAQDCIALARALSSKQAWTGTRVGTREWERGG
jgi:hypothetical protein